MKNATLVAPVSVVRNLGIYLDSDTSMRSHVAKTVSSYFSILRHLWSIRRSMSRPVLQSMVVLLVLSRLDFGNATLTGAPAYLLQQLQSVMNAAARLIFSSSRFDHISPLLGRLHCSRSGADFLQGRCSGVPMSTRFGAEVPVWWIGTQEIRFGRKTDEIAKFSILDEKTKFTIVDEIWTKNVQLIGVIAEIKCQILSHSLALP